MSLIWNISSNNIDPIITDAKKKKVKKIEIFKGVTPIRCDEVRNLNYDEKCLLQP
jgi:hypothetical protein